VVLLAVSVPAIALAVPGGLSVPTGAPLAGIVRVGRVPIGGATLLIRSVENGVAATVRVLRSASDGSFVLPGAPAGLYTILSFAPGFRPVVTRILHRAGRETVSFVSVELEKASGVLPVTPLGEADPWIARALAPGDVLRDEGVVAALEDAARPPGPPSSSLARASLSLPLRASVSSLTGFGAEGSANLSRTSLDVSGSLGGRFRWGLEGEYSRVSSGGTRLGDASRLALDVAPTDNQAIRISSRRQILDGASDTRFSAHGVDWSGSLGDGSRASVSARVLSQANLASSVPVDGLFTRAANAVELAASYRTDLDAGRFVRVSVGYRTTTGLETRSPSGSWDQETRMGGSVGMEVLPHLVLEGGLVGETSTHLRGLTPELTLTLKTEEGWRAFGFLSRRFERRLLDGIPLGYAGTEDGDLSRLARSTYRGGIRYDSQDGESFSVEVSRRELGGTYRMLLDRDFVDRLDSLYFFDSDVATELSSTTTFRLGAGLDGRIAARGGRVAGSRHGVIDENEATYGVADFSVMVAVTRTSIGAGYRVVTQTLHQGRDGLRNDVEAVDFSLAQAVPIAALRSFGSELRALLSVELGRRQEGKDEARSNRRFAGGLAFSF